MLSLSLSLVSLLLFLFCLFGKRLLLLRQISAEREIKILSRTYKRRGGFTGDTCLKYETIIFDVSLNRGGEEDIIPLEYL